VLAVEANNKAASVISEMRFRILNVFLVGQDLSWHGEPNYGMRQDKESVRFRWFTGDADLRTLALPVCTEE